MFASSISHQTLGWAATSSSGYLKYLSQRTLAVVLFVAFALMASVGGRESNAKKSTTATNTHKVCSGLANDSGNKSALNR